MARLIILLAATGSRFSQVTRMIRRRAGSCQRIVALSPILNVGLSSKRRRLGVRSEIERIHDDLLALIAELEALTEYETPDRQALASVRWRLSRASGRRLKLLEEIVYPWLLERSSAAEARTVSNLRESNAGLLAASRMHVAKWSVDKIMVDWADYCQDSAAMRGVMRMRIGLEKALLYPLLVKYAEVEEWGQGLPKRLAQ
ncbi:MAG: hypothetical protein ACT4N8_06045 [Sphingosinicella sp.]|uniref:hypothetical protein n=1 Tax=Sphingosinicella sp. TaxID=1917971 RepID=UPI004037AA05